MVQQCSSALHFAVLKYSTCTFESAVSAKDLKLEASGCIASNNMVIILNSFGFLQNKLQM
jgi:hypothetical protein